jgi:hypothetical protein
LTLERQKYDGPSRNMYRLTGYYGVSFQFGPFSICRFAASVIMETCSYKVKESPALKTLWVAKRLCPSRSGLFHLSCVSLSLSYLSLPLWLLVKVILNNQSQVLVPNQEFEGLGMLKILIASCLYSSSNSCRHRLSTGEKLEYLRAVKCLWTRPPKGTSYFPASRNRHDDFASLHINQTSPPDPTRNPISKFVSIP